MLTGNIRTTAMETAQFLIPGCIDFRSAPAVIFVLNNGSISVKSTLVTEETTMFLMNGFVEFLAEEIIAERKAIRGRRSQRTSKDSR